MNGEKSLASKIIDEMFVRYTNDGLWDRMADIVDISDDDDGDELSDEEGGDNVL